MGRLRILSGKEVCRILQQQRNQRPLHPGIRSSTPCASRCRGSRIPGIGCERVSKPLRHGSCIQTHRGFGFAREYNVERKWREARHAILCQRSVLIVEDYAPLPIGRQCLTILRSPRRASQCSLQGRTRSLLCLPGPIQTGAETHRTRKRRRHL